MITKKRLLLCLSLCGCLISCNTTNESSTNNENSSNEEISYDELKLFFTPSSYSKNEISKNIYGTFIEHIERCIYNGIYAEEILDRKFVAPIGNDVSQWKNDNNKSVLSESVDTYSGTYAAHFINEAIMSQRGLVLQENSTYNGYFYAKGKGTLVVSLKNATDAISKTITINSTEYKKYEYDVSIKNQGKYTISFTSLDGDFLIDSLSLMKNDNINGMRYDTLQLLKELNAPFYRWPGGNFVSGYDFYDGLLDKDKRVTKRNLNYAGRIEDFKDDNDRLMADLTNIEANGFYSVYEPNDFGIDEFIYMCNYLNATPNVVLNSGLGSVKMAIDEISYLNGTEGKYASMRPSKEPYNVKYISIGNEMNGSWQLGHMGINEYVKKHNEIANGIKSVSKDIKIIGVGDNYSSWSQAMLNNCKDNIDLLSEHFYATRKEDSVSDHIKSLKNQAEMRIKLHRNLKNNENVKMSIDEYAYENAKTQSRLKDGMGVASCLNVFIANSDVVDVACYSSTINAIQGQIYTSNNKAYLEGSGYACMLYSNNMENHYIKVTANTTKLNDYVEVSATINEANDAMTFSIINTSAKTLKITNKNIKEYVSRSYVTASSFEATGDELIYVSNDTSNNSCYVAPYSITLIKVKI